MLDHFKLFQELERVSFQIFATTHQNLQDLESLWRQISIDPAVCEKLINKKWSLLVPVWSGDLNHFVSIKNQAYPYQVLAVDGSQIYYDKHQIAACSLINVGVVFLHYADDKSFVEMYSYPEIKVIGDNQAEFLGADYINGYREQSELMEAVKKSCQYTEKSENPFVCMLDGSIIFFQLDKESKDTTQDFFALYMQQLQLFYERKILHVAYMSFPRTKDLINIVRLFVADYQEKNLDNCDYLTKFCDMDLLKIFLPQGHRTIVFESKAPICYAYPKHLKPYFCYLNVGQEIVRLEFCQWIAQDGALVDQVCAIALDQAQKGYGYPVALFEAHEQAVIKSSDREFFYEMIKQMYIKNNKQYLISAKSNKKIQPIL